MCTTRLSGRTSRRSRVVLGRVDAVHIGRERHARVYRVLVVPSTRHVESMRFECRGHKN